MIRLSALALASAAMTACGGRVLVGSQDSGSSDEAASEVEGSTGPEAGPEPGPESGSNANPLVGVWSYRDPGEGVVLTAEIIFYDDGTIRENLQLGDCTGTESISGPHWTSTADTLTVSGDETCTSSLHCMGGATMSCGSSSSGPIPATTCDYALSDGDQTLTLSSCGATTGGPADGIVLTRE